MFSRRFNGLNLFVLCLIILSGCESDPERQQFPDAATVQATVISEPFRLDTHLLSRSISFENPTGEPGQGGKTASRLGVGRKGSPARRIQPNETVALCDIQGPGTIRHIWITTRPYPLNLRSLVIRAYWDGQENPSIECPLGDFMGFSHGKVVPYHSAVHSVGEMAGMNIWLPMPFAEKARMTLTNDGEEAVPIYYQIDYTLGDIHQEDVGRLHVLFRRENPTTLREDFTLLPKRTGRGRFIGSIIGIRWEDPSWWGEGEIKVFMDGDEEFPTICGTGSEDYVGLSWGIQQTPFPLNGCSLNDRENGLVSMYRWHLPDPIYWQQECRITIQQIGHGREHEPGSGPGLYERQDDWSTATFWYEPVPSNPLPPLPGTAARAAALGDQSGS